MLFAIRTTAGQEVNVAYMIEAKAKVKNIPITSILALDTIRGYVIVEADRNYPVDELISGIRYVKSRVHSPIPFSEVEPHLIAKPIIEEINAGDIVEIIGGPLKGVKGRVIKVDRVRSEVTLELIGEKMMYSLPITVHVDYLRIAEKPKGE